MRWYGSLVPYVRDWFQPLTHLSYSKEPSFFASAKIYKT